MHCRPELKPVLLAKRMRRYWSILRYRFVESKFPRSKAKRNLLRLVARNEELARRIGITLQGIHSL